MTDLIWEREGPSAKISGVLEAGLNELTALKTMARGEREDPTPTYPEPNLPKEKKNPRRCEAAHWAPGVRVCSFFFFFATLHSVYADGDITGRCAGIPGVLTSRY